ncbi:MAG: glutaredoxin domain-containing protein [Pseudomonadota bacterium]
MSSDASAIPKLLPVALIVGAWLLITQLGGSADLEPKVCEKDVMLDADTVVMLSASWCRYCRQARSYLHEENIRHCEYDVEKNAEGQRRYAALPQKMIPVIEVYGRRIYGFNETSLREALNNDRFARSGR